MDQGVNVAHDVFISYSQPDREAADLVCASLERAGVNCWIAPRDVPRGKNYDEEIVQAISDCRVLVLIFSRHSNQSRHVASEIHLALERQRIVLPLRLENQPMAAALEYQLGRVQWEDAFPPPVEQHIDRLIARIRGEPASIRPNENESKPPPRLIVVAAAILMAVSAAVVTMLAVRSGTSTASGPESTLKSVVATHKLVPPVSLASELLDLPAGPILKELFEGHPDAENRMANAVPGHGNLRATPG